MSATSATASTMEDVGRRDASTYPAVDCGGGHFTKRGALNTVLQSVGGGVGAPDGPCDAGLTNMSAGGILVDLGALWAGTVSHGELVGKVSDDVAKYISMSQITYSLLNVGHRNRKR